MGSIGKFEYLFQQIPIALWEEDFSKVKKYLDSLDIDPKSLFNYLIRNRSELNNLIELIEVKEINQEAMKLFKSSNKELLFQLNADAYSNTALQGFIQQFIAIAHKRTEFELISEIDPVNSKESVVVDLHWKVLPGHEHDYSRVIVSMIDISTTSRLRQEIQKTEIKYQDLFEQLRFIVNNSPVIVWMTDQHGDIIFIDGRELSLFDVNREKLTGSNLTHIQTIIPVLQPSIEAMKGIYFDQVLEIDKFHFDIHVQPIYEDQKIIGVLGIAVNVTDQKHSELQQHQTQKMDAISRMAGKITKAANSALMAIIGYSDIILDNDGGELPHVQEINRIKNAVIQSSELIAQMSNYSATESLTNKLISINKIVENVTKKIRVEIQEIISLDVSLPAENVIINSESSNVEKALTSLIYNARDAIRTHGIISVTLNIVTFDKPKATQFIDLSIGEYVCLSVRDNGIGINKNDLSKIFDPFYTSKEHATGFGLSVVFGVVEQSSGGIEVLTEEGMGSEFKMYFPISSVSIEEIRNVTSTDHRGFNILLIDDDEIILNTVNRILTKEKYNIYPALGSEEALQIWKAKHGEIDLVLSDIVMPGINGIDLIKQFKEIHYDVPVIYMTGHSDNFLSEQGISTDEINLISKPFSSKELISAIKQKVTNIIR